MSSGVCFFNVRFEVALEPKWSGLRGCFSVVVCGCGRAGVICDQIMHADDGMGMGRSLQCKALSAGI